MIRRDQGGRWSDEPHPSLPPDDHTAHTLRSTTHLLQPAQSRIMLAAVLGAATVLGFSPFDLFPIPLVTLAALFRLCRSAATPRDAARSGFFFGLGLFGAGVFWVYISLHDFGGMPMPIAALAVALFCAFLALFPALATGLARSLATTQPRFILLAASAWTLTEWARGWLFTGFPWLAMGYAQVPVSPLAGWAPLGGVYALSFATALVAALLAVLPDWKTSRAGALIALSIAVLILLSSWGLKRLHWTAPAGEPTAVSLLQGNIPQELKFVPERLTQQMQTYLDLAYRSESRLIIMPESAIPLLKSQAPVDYLDLLKSRAVALKGDMLVGVFDDSEENAIYNSVMSIGSAPSQVYRKSHLVPFGEFIPLKWLVGWVYTGLLNMPLADQTPGARIQEPLKVAGQRVAVDICYEDAFGAEIIRQLPEATLLVNVSNDAWFGERLAPWQHTQIAQTRALETGRWMLRATNTGVTSIIDDRGEIVSTLPQSQAGALHGKAQGMSGATPYVKAGNGPIVGLCVALVALGWIMRRRSMRPAEN